MSKLTCGWCDGVIPDIFSGDEVQIQNGYYFVCLICLDLVKKLEKREAKKDEKNTEA